MYKVNSEFLKNRDQLIKFALDKGADPNTIDQLSYLPSIELSEALLENEKKSIDPGHFLRLIVNVTANEVNSEFLKDRYRLIELALDKGADPDAITYLPYLPSIEFSKILLENENNPMDPGHFLRLIINTNVYRHNPITGAYEINNELVQKTNELIKIAIEKGADPNTIDHLSYLPSIELSETLLENKNSPMNPGYFLRLIINTNVYHHNPTTGVYAINNELVQKADELIRMTIGKGADPNTIDYLLCLPSIELSEALLENKKKPMDPGHFLRLIVNVNSGFIKHRNQLIELALDKGADPNAIDHLFYLPSIELSETLLENKKNRWTQDIFLD